MKQPAPDHPQFPAVLVGPAACTSPEAGRAVIDAICRDKYAVINNRSTPDLDAAAREMVGHGLLVVYETTTSYILNPRLRTSAGEEEA